jgi:hypothetical protein
MLNVFGNRRRAKPPKPWTSSIFKGINQSTDEGNLRSGGGDDGICSTYKGINFEIVDDNVVCRKNYEVVNNTGVSLGDGYTYKFKSLWVQPGTTSDTILAGAEVYSGSTLVRCVLMKRNFAFTDAWSVAVGGASRCYGSGQSIYFSNAEFQFRNYTGDFFETSAEIDATILVNGENRPMFFYNGYLYLLKSDGWAVVTANKDTDFFSCSDTDITVDGTCIEFYSSTGQYPTGIVAGTKYYVRDAAAPAFKVAETAEGAAIDLTVGNGANMVCRISTERSIWYDAVFSYTEETITTGTAVIANDDIVEFQSTTLTLPKEISEGQKYFAVDVSGSSFGVSDTLSGTAITFTSNGSNMQVRKVESRYDDAPTGDNISLDAGERLFMSSGDTLYYNAGYYDDKGNPWDWWTQGYSGNIVLKTWDGDSIIAAVVMNGQKYVIKKNSFWLISGNSPPYYVKQIFTSKGTIAKNSVCAWMGFVFYATPEGMQSFDGTNSQAFLTDAIRKIWYPANDDCVCTVVGDTLHIYAYLYHPITAALGWAKLIVDLASGNTFYHDMSLGEATLTVDAVLEPTFTTLKSGIIQPEYWFACGDDIYKYGTSVPSSSCAALTYYKPSTDYGDATTVKYLSWLYVTGKGGTCVVTPVLDNTAGTALSSFELPSTAAVVKVPASGLSARIVGWKIQNSGGDPIEIHKLDELFRSVRN